MASHVVRLRAEYLAFADTATIGHFFELQVIAALFKKKVYPEIDWQSNMFAKSASEYAVIILLLLLDFLYMRPTE